MMLKIFTVRGLIPLDQILSGTKERDRFIDKCFERWRNDPDKPKFSGLNKKWASQFFDELRFYTQRFELIEPFCASLNQLAGLDFLTAFLIKRFVLGPGKETRAVLVKAKKNSPRILVEPQIRAEVEMLKKLMSIYVFDNPALVAQQFGQRKVITDLFQTLFNAVQPDSKHTRIIPQPFRDLLRFVKATDDVGRARIVADMIASMTEQQALLFHQRLLGLSPGSVRDLIIR
jgi:dGTPase